jgi:hypothetical protein
VSKAAPPHTLHSVASCMAVTPIFSHSLCIAPPQFFESKKGPATYRWPGRFHFEFCSLPIPAAAHRRSGGGRARGRETTGRENRTSGKLSAVVAPG